MNDFQRAPQAGETTLSEGAKALIEQLPADSKPTSLAEKFPRIMNRIAELWRRPAQMDKYFDELMVDKRGGRQGFPLGVLMDIGSLKHYHETVAYPKPKQVGVWDPTSTI